MKVEDLLRNNASHFWPCWPMAHRVTRERDRGWTGWGPPWTWLCSDIERDRPAARTGR